MPYQIGGAPPGLRGYLLQRQNQQAEQRGLLQILQIKNQMEQQRRMAEMAPLEMALKRAQIEALPTEAKLKQAQLVEAQRKAEQAESQQRAQMGLAGLLSRPYQAPGAPPPDDVAMSDQEAIQKIQAAGGRPMRVDVPNPAMGRALAIQADRTGGLMGKLYPQANLQQRPTVLNPGAGLVPPGGKQPVYTQPFAPRAEPLVIVQTPEGPKYQTRSAASGATPGARPSSSTREPMSEEAIRDLAIQSLYDSTVLAGYRRDTTAMARIADARVKAMKEAGVTSEDVVSGRAGFKADQVSLSKITPQYDAITAFEQTAIRNGKILIDLANTVDQSGVPVVEKWIRAGRQATGDPDVAMFNAQLHLYRAEAARILTQPNLSGVLSDTARQEMADFMKPGASAEQIRQTVQLLERDFLNRKHTLEEQIGNIRTRMRGRVGPESAQTTPGIRASDEDLIKKYLK